MSPPNVTCVLGMHRSGTSLITRMLALFGMDLGPPERMVASAPDNPRGFWEHRKFLHINERLLASWGGRWDRPPTLPPRWMEGASIEALERRTLEIIAADFGGSAHWGFKDPRTCLTVPFWKRLLPSMRYVLCLRNPLDVARSLERRDGLTPTLALSLWCGYLRSALHHTAASDRSLVVYEDVLEGVAGQLEQLASYVLSGVAPAPDAMQTARAFIDRDLQHHRDSPVPSDCGSDAAAVYRIYALLRERGLAAAALAESQLCEALDRLLPRLAAERTAERAAWERRVEAALVEIAALVGDTEHATLIDDQQWAGFPQTRRFAAFDAREGRDWGPPADDTSAVQQLDRLHASGVRFIVLAESAYWWLEHYTGFAAQLRARARCISNSERYMIFDAQPQPTWTTPCH